MKLEKTTFEFDSEQLMLDIRAKFPPDVSLRDIEAQCGVSASTLSRMDSSHTPDVDTLMKLLDAFDLKPNRYFVKVDWIGTIRE